MRLLYMDLHSDSISPVKTYRKKDNEIFQWYIAHYSITYMNFFNLLNEHFLTKTFNLFKSFVSFKGKPRPKLT